MKLEGKKEIIAQRILKEIIERLGFLENVGLAYLTLIVGVYLFVPAVRNLEDRLPDHDEMEKLEDEPGGE